MNFKREDFRNENYLKIFKNIRKLKKKFTSDGHIYNKGNFGNNCPCPMDFFPGDSEQYKYFDRNCSGTPCVTCIYNFASFNLEEKKNNLNWED